MPIRRTQSKKDQELADLVHRHYWWSAQVRQPRVEAYDRSYLAHDPHYIDRSKVTRPPYIKTGFLHRILEQQTTQILEAMDVNGVFLNVTPPNPDARLLAENCSNWLEYQYRYQGSDLQFCNSERFEQTCKMGLKYGDCDMIVQWNPDAGVVEGIPVDPYDTYRDGSHGRWTIVRRVVTLGQFHDMARAISRMETQIVVGPDGEPKEIEVSRDKDRAMKAYKRVAAAIKRGERQTNYFYNPFDTEHGNSRRYAYGRLSGDSEAMEQGDFDTSKDPYNATIAILEYYETGRNGAIAKIVPSWGGIGGDDLVIQREQNPYKTCPIVTWRPHPVDLEHYGMGNEEIAGRAVKAMDYNFRAGHAIVGAAGWPPLLIDKHQGLRQQQVQNMYGKILPVSNVATAMKYMSQDISPAMHSFGQSNAQQAADFALGENAMRRGDVGQAKNATAAAVGEAYGNITDKTHARRWGAFLERVGYCMLAVGKVHCREPQVVPALGRHSGEFINVMPEMFDVNWVVSFGGNQQGANRQQMIATHLNIIGTLAGAQVLDLDAEARHILRLAGELDPSQFLMKKDPTPDLLPEEEARRLLEEGQVPQVAANEDMLAHLQGHQKTLRDWAEEIGQNDWRFKALGEHMQNTMSLFQQQQMQQQGAGGAGNGQGAAPLQPGQVGGAGQPKSYQGATKDVNADRQKSNVAAVGGRPGGVAPQRTTGKVQTGGGGRQARGNVQ